MTPCSMFHSLSRLVCITGNPRVTLHYPYPYPPEPAPVSTGTGFLPTRARGGAGSGLHYPRGSPRVGTVFIRHVDTILHLLNDNLVPAILKCIFFTFYL